MKLTSKTSNKNAITSTFSDKVASPGYMEDNRTENLQLRAMLAMTQNNPRVVAQCKVFNETVGRSMLKKENNTGLPDNLKSGVENLSGCSLDDVKVHYNSNKPFQLQAHAYAQGVDIHIAPGQEKHLPHEAWHVVQQKQGRVKSMKQIGGLDLNDDNTLEKEADEKGSQALKQHSSKLSHMPKEISGPSNLVAQRQIRATNPTDFLKEQEELQTSVLKDPAKYAGRLVTVGFEHEFGAFVDEKLHGVSHLRIGESAQKMPYKNLPFYLETDAGNEIELVDPPFLIETIEPGKPIPHPVDLDIVSQMMEGLLYSVILNFPTLNQLVQEFRKEPGINFRISPVKVQAENLSDKTKNNYTHESAHLSSVELLRMRLGPSQKYGGGKISTQINFATNAATYSKLQEYNDHPLKTEFEPMAFAVNFAERIKQDIEIESQEQKIFFDEFHRQLIAQGIRPLMDHIQTLQQKEYRGGTRIRDGNENELGYFRQAGELTSKIKDVNRTWLKDSLMSLGSGILTQDDWNKVLKFTLYAQSVLKKDVLNQKDIYFYEKVHIRKAMLSMFKEMRKQIDQYKKGNKEVYAPQNKPGFMEHDEGLLGVRQDTYIDPENAQMPGVWDQQLHVVEVRSDSVKAVGRLVNEKKLSETPVAGQVVKDGRKFDDDRSKAINYNLSKHAYFVPGRGYMNPSTKKIRPLVGERDPMPYSKALKMFFDPSMDLYFDPIENAYFDQAVGTYYHHHVDPEQSYYYNKSTRFQFDSACKMYKFKDDLFFDKSKGAWYEPSKDKFTFARINTFENPSEKIKLAPENLVPKEDFLLKDIYHPYDKLMIAGKRDVRAILKTLGELSIPYDTNQDQMIKTAIKEHFGDKVTLRQIYFDIEKIIGQKTEYAELLKSCIDAEISYDSPIENMVTNAWLS